MIGAKLRFLCANDVYKPERFSTMAHLKEKFQGEGTTKCVLAGDFLGGSLFASSSKGESMIKVCNSVGFDYVVLGNHEFDYGDERLRELMDMTSIPWLGSNVRIHSKNSEGNFALFHSAISDIDIFECESYRVGVFGVCTASTPTLSDPSSDVIFEDEVDHARRATALLRDAGCDIIVAMTHVSISIDKAIAAIQGINLIIGGHDHDPFLLLEHDTLIVKCGQNIDHLGIVDLNISRSSTTGRVKICHSFQLLCTDGLQGSDIVDEVINKYKALLEDSSEESRQLTVVDNTHKSAIFSTRSCDVRVRECASVCLVTDAMLQSYIDLGYDCDFAILNGGFVRGDRVYLPGSPIYDSDVLNELPFKRSPVLLAMTGKDLLEGIEQMLAGAPRPVGSFPHMSVNFKGEYDLNLDPMNRVKLITIKGKALDLEKEYRVVVSNFYFEKEGDGVTSFVGQKKVHDHKRLISSLVCDYLANIDFVSGLPPGRFTNTSS